VETPGPTLLFEMSALFEALLGARLRAMAGGCVVYVQDPRFALDTDRCFPLRPDLVVEVSGVPVLVVDAKWKRLPGGLASVDPSDLRQAFAYARILNTRRAALLYPRLSETGSVNHELVVADGSGVRLILRQVTLPTKGWGALDQELSDLLRLPFQSTKGEMALSGA
jgi:5-methylcytosine-specific restriction enzyme subunit McrC